MMSTEELIVKKVKASQVLHGKAISELLDVTYWCHNFPCSPT